MSRLSGLLDIHAPVKTRQLNKPAPTAKCMKKQHGEETNPLKI